MRDQLVCRSIVRLKLKQKRLTYDKGQHGYQARYLYTVHPGGTVKTKKPSDAHGDCHLKDAKVDVTFDKGILSDDQTLDQWIIKPNSVNLPEI